MGAEGMGQPTGQASGIGRTTGQPTIGGVNTKFSQLPPQSAPQTAPTQPAATAQAPVDYGNFLNDYREQGSDYGGKPSNFTGVDPATGQQFINGRLFAGEGMTQSGDKSTPGLAFQNVLNQYGDQIKQLTGQAPATTAANPLPIPGGEPIPGGAPQAPTGASPGGNGNPIGRGPGLPPITGGGPLPPGYGQPDMGSEQPNDYGLPLPQVQGVPNALDPNSSSLPGMPQSADQTRQSVIDAMMGRENQDLAKRQDQTNSDLIARGIRPGTEAYQREMDLIERSRNDARQQAEIAGGNAAQQQFAMDAAKRAQAVGEQGQSFTQALTGGAQTFGQQGQLASLLQSLQGQSFGQQGQSRRDAIAELLAQRQTPLNEITALMGGSQVSNPFSVPGYNGNTSVAPPPIFGAAQAQGQAANNTYNAQTGTYNSALGGLANLGGSALGAFF